MAAPSKKNQDEGMSELIERVDRLIRVAALSLVENRKQKDQIRVLTLAGFKPTEIAELLGTTPNTVSVAISVLRREKELPVARKHNGD